MARTNKVGIDYFPLDVDFFQDDKIQLVEAEFGVKGGYIALRLLCKIYKEGYFYKWGADECLLFAKNIGVDGVSGGIIDEVIKGLVKRGFFDKTVFNKFGVLTSSGIQKRYFEVAKRYKEVKVIEEYLLADVSEVINVNIIKINVDTNSINVDINAQKKRKEIKINNISIFDSFRKDFPGSKRGLKTEFDCFTKKHKDWESCLPLLLQSLNDQKVWREQTSKAGGFVPPWANLSTWLNQRRWEQELPEITQQSISNATIQTD